MAQLDDFSKIIHGGQEINKVLHQGKTIWEGIYVAQDSDFVKVDGYWAYRGTELEIKIPHVIQGESVTRYSYMFSGNSPFNATPVTRVVSDNPNVTSMQSMFANSKATILDLSSFDASQVDNMSGTFWNSSATTGYARTQADADKFNSSPGKPANLKFVVKR